MTRKLFVTDLDGTLLNSQQKLSDYTVDTLNSLIRDGMLITFSTSRSFYTTSKLLNRVDFKIPCITYNGVYVIAAGTGEVIRKNLLDPAIFEEVLSIAKDRGMKPYIFGKNSKQEEKLIYEEPENSAQVQYIEERMKRGDKRLEKVIQKNSAPILDELININFLYPLNQIQQLEQLLRPKYDDIVSIKVIKDIYNEGYYYLEVSNKDANKGKMLDYLSDMMQVERDNITVFGDQANDVEMFERAGTKVAVANANVKLKEMADIITESNDLDGVAKYLNNTPNR